MNIKDAANYYKSFLAQKEKEKRYAELSNQLFRHEGYRRFAYKCTANKLTIGIGRNIDQKGGTGISKDEAEYLLRNDIEEKTEKLAQRFPRLNKLDNVRQDVLINMVFNLGPNNQKTLKKTLEEVEKVLDNKSEWKKVSEVMLSGAWAKQVKGRAKELANQMKTGEYKNNKYLSKNT